jgi:predicted ATP-dependent endonuclease of OLD family
MMPKVPIDYQNTIMYKIVCKDLTIQDFYVGHTTNFNHRKSGHKNSAKKIKIYECIKRNGGWDNWDMVEIEKYPCNDANEARARERHHYEVLQPTLNMKKPFVGVEEDKILQINYNKQYYDKNKDIFKELNTQYYEENKEYFKDYYENKTKEKWSKKYECECGDILY